MFTLLPEENAQSQDPWQIVRDHVLAKAAHITSLAECSWLYGSNSKTKELQGVVVEVLSMKTSTGWTSNIVVAGGGGATKQVSLNIQSVHQLQ